MRAGERKRYKKRGRPKARQREINGVLLHVVNCTFTASLHTQSFPFPPPLSSAFPLSITCFPPAHTAHALEEKRKNKTKRDQHGVRWLVCHSACHFRKKKEAMGLLVVGNKRICFLDLFSSFFGLTFNIYLPFKLSCYSVSFDWDYY
ncbi:hypothetical protein E2C01_057617 [Portunus trituberculatus]|uniref:Uncharacterized protein n=1 Tax=Portunus trituberculatus TaxID=210409 RepID=A0A5B7H0U2_PORTR|nr:hypothetical protein [Portunus trituberculatus]